MKAEQIERDLRVFLGADVHYAYIAQDGTSHFVSRADIESLTEDGEMDVSQAIAALAIEIQRHQEEE